MTMVAVTGAVGQAMLLVHNLVDCYPYKMMSNPSDRFYEGIAYAGLVLGPAVGFVGTFFLRRFPYCAPVVACLLSPAVFLLLFAGAHLILGVDLGNTSNFDHTTPLAVFAEFTEQVIKLLVVGAAIGALCGLLAAVGFRITARRTSP